MQLTEVFYFVLFSISVTASYAQKGYRTTDIAEIRKNVSKRDAAVIIDNYPLEFSEIKKPKVIYRRISKQRYRAPKPEYGPPKPKFRLAKKTTTKKPYKKYKVKKANPKYPQPSSKRPRAPKPRRRPTVSRPKSKFSIPKQVTQQPVYYSDSTGFGEPPIQMVPKEFDFRKPPQYGEPPVDSYGAPLKTTPSEVYPTNPEEEYVDATAPYEKPDLTGGLPKYHRWQDIPSQDNNFAYSNKIPQAVLVSKVLNDEDAELYEDLTLNSYSDIFKYNGKKPTIDHHRENHMNFNNELIQNSQKYLNKPWKVSSLNNEDHDQIIVGGQYAEPPARIVPKGGAIPSLYFDESRIFSGFVHPETPSSATISPYVNYKNSNMAFSPQNLNDAFGIVDK